MYFVNTRLLYILDSCYVSQGIAQVTVGALAAGMIFELDPLPNEWIP